MKRFVGLVLAAFALMPLTTARAQSAANRPWLLPDPILVIDPYDGNAIDWDKLVADKAVKAVLHRAFFGLTPDKKYVARVKEAKQRGLLAGLYLLGRPGDPIKQADALIGAGTANGVTLLALDIENLDPAKSMTLDNAVKFIDHVHEKTGRYPLLYVNFSTYKYISSHYPATSVFARTPLWIARFANAHGMDDHKIWPDYTLWQFQSEINCTAGQTCFRPVAGTQSDMDVNIFRGSEAELKALFGAN